MVKTFGRVRALDGLDLTVAHRRGARLPRPERRRQVHHHPGPARASCAPTPARARCSAATRGADAVALHRRLAYVPGRCQPVAEPVRRRGDRPARPARAAALDARRRDELLERFELDPRKKGRAYSKGNRQKVAHRRRAGLRRRAADPGRADHRPGPVDGGGLPGLHQRREGPRPHGAAVQPHPVRGRGAVRPGQHHPRRRGGRDRHPRPSCGT